MVLDIDHTHTQLLRSRPGLQSASMEGTWCLELGCGNSATWVQPGTPSVTLDGRLVVKGLKGKEMTHFILFVSQG